MCFKQRQPLIELEGKCVPMNSAGFTLLELLLVLVIMALTVGVVGAKFSSALEGVRWKRSAWELVGVMRSSRGLAVTEGRVIDFSVNPQTRQYQWSDEPPRDWPAGISLDLQTGNWTPPDGALEAIYFYPDGSSSGGSVAVISPRGDIMISVNWLTGGVSIDAE